MGQSVTPYIQKPAYTPPVFNTINTPLPNAFNVKFRTDAANAAPQESQIVSQLSFDVTPGFGEHVVPGSLRVTFGGVEYLDRQGQLVRDIDKSTGAGEFSGTFDYSSGVATVTHWASGGANSGQLISLLTDVNYSPVDNVVFRIAVAPVKTGSFSIRAAPVDGGGQITATADASGAIDTTDMTGTIDYETGIVNIRFGQWITAAGNESEWFYAPNLVEGGLIFKPRFVYADTIFYNAVSYTYLPLSADILGLNPVRLPADGRVPVYATGDVIVVLHDQKTTGTFNLNDTTYLGRGRIAKLSVRDLGNNIIPETAYSADLDTGIITWGDMTGISQPVTITDRIEDMAVLTDVQITGELAISSPLTHNFPANETLIANAVIYGDLFAYTSIPFDQKTWTNVWSDELIGSSTSAQFNNVSYPIVVNNASAVQEEWAIIFTSSQNFDVVGRNVGEIATGSVLTDCAPINPNTNEPYFTIPATGWGGGWSSGNVLRFNTYAANVPVWVIQAINQGDATDTDYTFCIEIRGDVDTP